MHLNTKADRRPHLRRFARDAILVLYRPASDFLLIEKPNLSLVKLQSSTNRDVGTHGHDTLVSLDTKVQAGAFLASLNVKDFWALQVEEGGQSFRHEFEENGNHKVSDGEGLLWILFVDACRVDEMRVPDRSVDR